MERFFRAALANVVFLHYAFIMGESDQIRGRIDPQVKRLPNTETLQAIRDVEEDCDLVRHDLESFKKSLQER